MEEYLIGAGAVLTAGPSASIAGASLHAQTDPELARQVRAAVIDFEASRVAELSRLLIVAPGWDAARFGAEVTQPLLAKGECTLAEVFAHLGRVTGADEVHLFARWLPDGATQAALREAGLSVIAHPIEAIERAALVTGQRLSRWSPFRAA